MAKKVKVLTFEDRRCLGNLNEFITTHNIKKQDIVNIETRYAESAFDQTLRLWYWRSVE